MRAAFLILALVATVALAAIAVGVHRIADRLDQDKVHSVEIYSPADTSW